MSKENNLTDFLTDVADAIRGKKGTTEKINPQNFSEEIKSLGTERTSVEWNDVNFYDYDGIRLYSYSWEEAMAMTELPPLPTQKGLICQEWNYTLEDIKAQNGACDVGATYITDDGNTRLYLTIKNERAKDVSLHFPRHGGVTVDWGDGTSVETTEKELSHQYAEYGEYVVAFKPKSYIAFEFGDNRNVLGYNLAPSSERYDSLTKVELGSAITNLGNYTFDNCSSLRTVTIPNTTITMGASTFRSCTSLKCIVMPKGLNYTSNNTFSHCASLKIVSLSKGITEYDFSVFGNCPSLRRIVFPVGVTSLGISTFTTTILLSRVVIPDGVTEIGNSVFSSCFRLQCIKIPASVTKLGIYALYVLRTIAYIDFSSHATIPTLSSSSSIGQLNAGTKIIVPDTLYDEWIVATNWSELASYIVKDSEYTKPL